MRSARRVLGGLSLAVGLGAASAQALAEPEVSVRYVEGAETFKANCAVCHRANGAGTPGLAPPVRAYAPRFLGTAEGRVQLAITVLFGMYGDIVVDQRHYNFKMPEFSRFDDASLAAVLNYVAFDLGGAPEATPALTAADVAAQRPHPIDGDAVRQHRAVAIGSLAP